MFTVEHLLFNTAVVVLFFKENEWKWCGLCMLLSNFIDLDNFYSFQLDDGDASALEIHYLHGQSQLNLILFFSCTLVLLAHRLKPSAEPPLLAFTIGLVFHVVGDWWSWMWGYSVTVSLFGIGSFVLATLLRSRYSPYRFYVFLFIGHVCTIFTLGFIVFLILIGDDEVDTTEHMWPTIVDNCARLIMVLPWYFLMRVAEVDVQDVVKTRVRRRDPATSSASNESSESESTEEESSKIGSEGDDTRLLNTLLPVPKLDSANDTDVNDDSIKPDAANDTDVNDDSIKPDVDDDFIKQITPEPTKASILPKIEMTQVKTEKQPANQVSTKKEFEMIKKGFSLPRQSVRDPTRIDPNLLASPKHRGSGSIFSLGMFNLSRVKSVDCYE